MLFGQKINFIITSLCLFSFNFVSQAKLNFGSKNASLVVKDDSTLKIVTTQMNIINGTLENKGFGIVTGPRIHFDRGRYIFLNSASEISASLEPDANRIELGDSPLDDGATMIANAGGLAGVELRIRPGLNILRGQPLFFGQNDINFMPGSSLLAIAVQNTLNTNLTLNGGVLFLQDDLRLGDSAIILDNGIVALNNRRLSLGGAAAEWNGTIIWDSALDLQLNSAVTLNGTWFFLGEGQINGNGNVIDIAGGGRIIVPAGSRLRLSGVQIKGLGSGTINLADDAELILSDVVIEMASNYDIDSGTVIVEGDSKIITKEHILEFKDGPGGTVGKLIVDRVTLTYDPVATIDIFNIRPQLILDIERKHIELIGGGEIGLVRRDTATLNNYSEEAFVKRYSVYAPYRPFNIYPTPVLDAPPGTLEFNVTVDGNTNFLGFTQTDEKIFIVTKGVQATLQNLVLREFSTKHLDLREGASLVFGNKTTITFARDEILEQVYTFEGETKIKGGGAVLDLSNGGELVVQGTNSRLILDGLCLKGVTGTNIRCLDPSSTIVLRNVKLIQSGDFNFNTGSIEIEKDTNFVGPFSFNFNATGMFLIRSDATLLWNRGKIFRYSPANGDRTLFKFEDSSSVLSLDQATLSAPAPGIQLVSGRLIIGSVNFLINDGATSEAEGITLGNGLVTGNIEIDNTGSLELLSGFFNNQNV